MLLVGRSRVYIPILAKTSSLYCSMNVDLSILLPLGQNAQPCASLQHLALKPPAVKCF